MNTLLDLGPLTEKVEIRGIEITVSGLTALDIFNLLVRFPEIRTLFDSKNSSWTAAEMMKSAPKAIYSALAICTGANTPEAEKVASMLPVAYQTKLLSAVLRLTFPQGVGPFAQEFRQMIDGLTAEAEELQNLSQSASLASLQVDMPPRTKRGVSCCVN